MGVLLKHFVAARLKPSAALLCLLLALPCAQAQIYASTTSSDETNSSAIVLSNYISNDTPQLLIEAPALPGTTLPNPKTENPVSTNFPTLNKPFNVPVDLMPVINTIASEHGISPHLLKAVIATESGFNTRALSPKGAQGLMQLMPATAKRFGAADAFIPAQNIRAGAAYLKWLLALFGNDLELTLAAYNAGENAVIKAGNRIPAYAETKQYVPRVLAYLKHFSKLG
jgi:soluble lytic murein transglycosylase-like protein